MREKTMHQPTNNDTGCQNKEQQQGPRHGYRPEQKADFNNSYILDHKKNYYAGKDQTKDKFKMHHEQTPFSVVY
jgi:hypothetical protein